MLKTACKAKEFLENCRVLKEREEMKEGKGIAVLFDSEEKRFNFCEYNNTSKKVELIWIGTIYLAKIFAKTKDPNEALLIFKKEANKIVKRRKYKIDQSSFVALNSMKSYISAYGML